ISTDLAERRRRIDRVRSNWGRRTRPRRREHPARVGDRVAGSLSHRLAGVRQLLRVRRVTAVDWRRRDHSRVQPEMRAAVLRCIGGGVWALTVWGLAQIGYLAWMCPPHRAWQNAQHRKTADVLDVGERVRRTNDAVFVCETTHYLGPIALHRDLDCYCA